MPAPESIKQLTERFREHIDTYTRSNYNETQLRREFLDPFFGALGWDVFNEKGYAGDYKDVVHEAALKMGRTTKAPDYSFRIGGQRKFFVEAKKPSVDVKGDPHPAYQLRRYAWTAQLPLSILTDFEEFAVYDCRSKPSPKDKAANARILYMTYDQYESRWDEIEAVFARESILKGGFDKYASAKTRKRGTAEPDDEFLQLLESWRSSLAQNIARNNDLSARQINHAVQLIIDRIVFLRICEDRGVEEADTLQNISKGKGIYAGLLKRFRLADAKYNSGLFHFENEPGREAPDTLTPSLTVSDGLLKEIIANLYYPESPYEFSVFRAEMLGHIYERFLGSVISLSGKTAKVEEKPEVRKAGGVYYTPTYIVDYIVEHTVGELLKDRTVEIVEVGQGRGKKKIKTPRMDKPLRVLDPACGSGSFLLGAYDHLLDWHLRFYSNNDPEFWAKLPNPPIAHEAIPDEGAIHSDYKLTTHEKKRILTEHIFGVDIDAQAVEVTKLSLLLKVLEGESEETLQPLLFAKERALPDLSDNIRCGNSLIGSDFYGSQQGAMFDEEEHYRINAFDWEVEFREIMKSGGFDVVIGNPPYIQLSMQAYYDEGVSHYLKTRHGQSMGRLNTFALFMYEGINNLVAKAGLLGFIVPNTVLTQGYYQFVRSDLLKHRIASLTTFTAPVFEGAVVETVIAIAQRCGSAGTVLAVEMDNDKAERPLKSRGLLQRYFHSTFQNAFNVRLSPRLIELKEKLETGRPRLGVIANLNQAIALKADRGASIGKSKLSDSHVPVLDGRHINRYQLKWGGDYLNYDVNNIHSCKRRDIFEADEKIFLRRVGERIIATLDTKQHYALNTIVVITLRAGEQMSLSSLLGALNSTLLNYYYATFLKSTKRTFSEIQARQLARLPFEPKLSDDGRLEKLVQSLLDMNERLLGEASERLTPQERRVLEGRISATDREIDLLVYELYGLTDDEIAIVEEATAT